MARNHFMVPTAPSAASVTSRFGASAAGLNYKEVGKAVKLAAESQFSLCAAGDAVEGWISSVEQGTQNAFTIAGVYIPQPGAMVFATADGLQATAGTGSIVVGDYVVCGTVTAAGTALTAYQRVTKATDQATAKTNPFAYRVVSLAAFGGAGAVGDTVVLQRV